MSQRGEFCGKILKFPAGFYPPLAVEADSCFAIGWKQRSSPGSGTGFWVVLLPGLEGSADFDHKWSESAVRSRIHAETQFFLLAKQHKLTYCFCKAYSEKTVREAGVRTDRYGVEMARKSIELTYEPARSWTPDLDRNSFSLKRAQEEFTCRVVMEILNRYQGDIRAAAQYMQVSERSVYRWIKKEGEIGGDISF